MQPDRSGKNFYVTKLVHTLKMVGDQSFSRQLPKLTNRSIFTCREMWSWVSSLGIQYLSNLGFKPLTKQLAGRLINTLRCSPPSPAHYGSVRYWKCHQVAEQRGTVIHLLMQGQPIPREWSDALTCTNFQSDITYTLTQGASFTVIPFCLYIWLFMRVTSIIIVI